jgi:hypothetical protein
MYFEILGFGQYFFEIVEFLRKKLDVRIVFDKDSSLDFD